MAAHRIALLAIASLFAVAPIRADDEAPPLAVAPFDATKAKQHQDAWVKYLKADVEITNRIGMKLKLIPPGEFTMGSAESEKDHLADETQHVVKVTKAFYLGTHEVTQREWKSVMKTEPWWPQGFVKEDDDCPANYLFWDDAVEFCRKLSQQDGNTYRLPTEAEWEFACRAGTQTRFYFGNDSHNLATHAWWGFLSVPGDGNVRNELYAHKVGLMNPNPFGLYDMHGNVSEWCSDWYGPYVKSRLNDPSGPEKGTYHVGRGGSFADGQRTCRSARRRWLVPEYRDRSTGFRVVLIRQDAFPIRPTR